MWFSLEKVLNFVALTTLTTVLNRLCHFIKACCFLLFARWTRLINHALAGECFVCHLYVYDELKRSVNSSLYPGNIRKPVLILYLPIPHLPDKPTSGFGSSCRPHIELTHGVVLAAPATRACQLFAQSLVNSAKRRKEAWYRFLIKFIAAVGLSQTGPSACNAADLHDRSTWELYSEHLFDVLINRFGHGIGKLLVHLQSQLEIPLNIQKLCFFPTVTKTHSTILHV